MGSDCHKIYSTNHFEGTAAETGVDLGHNVLRDKGCRQRVLFGNCQDESLGLLSRKVNRLAPVILQINRQQRSPSKLQR